MEIETNNPILEISSNVETIEIETPKTSINKNHAAMKNLDYENSGHTGFASSKDLEDALSILEDLESTKITKLHNQKINLSAIPVGVYILTGAETTIESRLSDRITTYTEVISDDEKYILFSLGDDQNGRGILFYYVNQIPYMRVFYGTASRIYSLAAVMTINGAETITGIKTFNSLPKTNITPTLTTHLTNKQYVDSKINQAKIPTDLGYIDLDDYDDDVFAFMDTIIDEGRYKFVDSYDEFEWYVEVYRTDNYVGQTYWGSEEGFTNKCYRHGFYNEDDDTVEWQDWTTYLTFSQASSTFAVKSHVHYTTKSVDDIRTWLDEMKNFGSTAYEVTQQTDKHKFIVQVNLTSYTLDGENHYIRYQEYYDIEEPNKIYKRTGKASSNYSTATITWGDWYVFEGAPE